MKVLWSWQSDTPGRTARHFVRDCLQVAVHLLNVELNEASELEAAARDTIELDCRSGNIPVQQWRVRAIRSVAAMHDNPALS